MFPVDLASVLTGASIPQLRSWNRTGLLIPEGVKDVPQSWSYADLVAVRTVVALRREISLQKVRTAFRNLDVLQLHDHPSTYEFVADNGSIAVRTPDGTIVDLVKHPGQLVLKTFEDVFAPFEYRNRSVPDFRNPRTHLAVDPHKLGGWPTIENSRIAFDVIGRFADADDVEREDVAHFYPGVSEAQVIDAVSLFREVRERATAA